MATVKAVIRKSKMNNQGVCLVFIQYGHDGKSTLFTTKVKVKPIHWNDRRQLVDSTKGVQQIKANEELTKELKSEDNVSNAIINKKASRIRQISKRLMLEDIEPTISAVKEAFKRKREGKDIIKADFFDLVQEYIDDNSQRLKYGTLKGFKVLKNHLLAFQKQIKKRLEAILFIGTVSFCVVFSVVISMKFLLI